MQLDKVFGDTGGDLLFTVALTPAATAAALSAEQAFTLTGLPSFRVGDLVAVSGPSSGNAVTIGNSRINTTGQLVISFINPTAGSLTHAAGTFTVRVSRACN